MPIHYWFIIYLLIKCYVVGINHSGPLTLNRKSDADLWIRSVRTLWLFKSGPINSKMYFNVSPPLRLASTNTRIALTHSSKLSGVTWAASRTMKESVSTHLMRDLVSCWPRSWPSVRLYWLTSGWFSWALELTGGVLLDSRSSFPTWKKTETKEFKYASEFDHTSVKSLRWRYPGAAVAQLVETWLGGWPVQVQPQVQLQTTIWKVTD